MADFDRYYAFSEAGPLNSGTSIRLLSPLGLYPNMSFQHPEATVIIRPNVCAVMTRFTGIAVPKDYYSEVAFASPFDVRALGALLLACTLDAGIPSLYPTSVVWATPVSDLDLAHRDSVEHFLGEFGMYLNREGSEIPQHHRPPSLGGTEYGFMADDAIDVERVHHIFGALDVNDRLLIRGLGALIQANMLACHHEFVEQACMSLWVCMESSLHLVIRHLKAHGNPKASAFDAGAYLDQAFENKYQSSGYFADFYSDRIRTVHPNSRYGVYHFAPLEADDFYELNETLVATYDFIVTGNVREALKGH